MMQKLKVLTTKEMYEGRVFGVRRDHVIEPNGVNATRDVVTHPGSVVVLPVFANGRLLLIRQFRYATGMFLWELVAGRKNPGETFLRAAHREMVEEIGYTAKRMRKLMDLFPTPGFVTERMVIYLATGLKEGIARPEEDEKIEQRVFTLSRAEQWICAGKIRDAKSVAGILYYSRFVARGG